MSYFRELYDHNKSKIKVGLDLSNYVDYDLKNATGADTSDFAKKIDLADFGKLETTATDLGNVCNVVKTILLKWMCMMYLLKRLIL